MEKTILLISENKKGKHGNTYVKCMGDISFCLLARNRLNLKIGSYYTGVVIKSIKDKRDNDVKIVKPLKELDVTDVTQLLKASSKGYVKREFESGLCFSLPTNNNHNTTHRFLSSNEFIHNNSICTPSEIRKLKEERLKEYLDKKVKYEQPDGSWKNFKTCEIDLQFRSVQEYEKAGYTEDQVITYYAWESDAKTKTVCHTHVNRICDSSISKVGMTYDTQILEEGKSLDNYHKISDRPIMFKPKDKPVKTIVSDLGYSRDFYLNCFKQLDEIIDWTQDKILATYFLDR